MTHQPQEQASYPFLLKLIVSFFAVDAVIKGLLLLINHGLFTGVVVAVLGIHHYGEHPEVDQLIFPVLKQNTVCFSMLVIIVFDLMLVVQLLLRSSAGRAWALIFTAGTAAWAVYLACFEPLVWLGRGVPGRIAVLVFLAVYVLIFIYLLRPNIRELFTN